MNYFCVFCGKLSGECRLVEEMWSLGDSYMICPKCLKAYTDEIEEKELGYKYQDDDDDMMGGGQTDHEV